MTAKELMARIKDNPHGTVLVRVDDELLPIVGVIEPYQGATILKAGQVTTHEG